jgi:LysR family transcriptional regulator, nitrogen assimilation regulatory protein
MRAMPLLYGPRGDAVDLRQLRYFVGIVDEGSISLAAQRLRVAQPALSHHVRNLEGELGVPLLVRGAHGVRPTDAGTRLYERATGILKSVEETLDQVRDLGGEPRGPAVLGLPASVALVLAVPLIEAVRERLPRVRLRLMEGMSGTILEWLHGNRLDLAMLFDVAKPTRTLRTKALLTEDLYAVCPPGEDKGDVAFADAAGLPLILPGRPHGLRERLEKAAREAGITLNVTAEVDGLPQIKLLVERGVGFSILSLSAVREEVSGGRIGTRRIVSPTLQRTVSLCTLKERPPTAAAEAVRQLLHRTIRDLIERDAWPCRPCGAPGTGPEPCGVRPSGP